MTDTNLEFRSLPGLWKEYADITRALTFDEGRFLDRDKWQASLRAAVWSLLGVSPGQICSPSPQILDLHEEERFTIQTVAIQTQPGEYMPCYVLIPRQPANTPLKPVIALHGHGSRGASAIVMAPQDQAGAEFNQRLNYDYAGQLAESGFMVFAPELRGFGARMEALEFREGEDPEWISSCHAVSVDALLLGKTLLGMRVLDVICLIDYIETWVEVASQPLGCVGFSGGGMVALFSAALDERISCAVVSGYFNTFRDSIMAIRHCICNYVPGIARVAEMADIAGLIAPRPLLIESGTQDLIFPHSAVQQAFIELQKIYAHFSAADNLALDVFEGEHRWGGQAVTAWLERWL